MSDPHHGARPPAPGLSLRQAQALLWLRATLWKRALVQQRAVGRVLVMVLALLWGGLASAGLTFLVLEAASKLSRDPPGVQARGGALAVFSVWLGMALMGRLWFAVRTLAGGGPFLDPRRFLPYAVPARVVSLINFIASLLDPVWLFFYPPLAGIALGASWLPGAPPAWALLLSEAASVVAVAALLHLLSALGGALLVAKPGLQRGLTVLVAFGAFFAFQLMAAHPSRIGFAQLFANRRWQIIAFTPPGWAAVLARALGDRSALHAFTPLCLLGLVSLASVWAAHRLSLREAQRPVEAPQLRAGRGRELGWNLPLVNGELSALFEKELKTQLRVGWLQLVVVPAGYLLLRMFSMKGASRTFDAQPLLVAAAYAHLGVLDVATNIFGRDAFAARSFFLYPVERRALFAAKNFVAYLFSLFIFVLLCAVAKALGEVTPSQIAVGLLAHAATFPLLAGFGNVASILWPTPVRKNALRARARGAGPVGARFFALALLVGGAWAPSAVAKIAHLPPLAAYTGALLALWIAYGGLLALSAGLFESRREPLLAALAKDE